MKLSNLGLIVIFFSISTYANDLGVIGTVFDIKEPHLVEQMQAKLSQLSAEELERHQQELKKRIVAQIEEPVAVNNIVKAINTRTYEYDPTFVVDKDYRDSEGNIIAIKGTRINPLDHVTYDKKLYFIDANDKAQVKWLKAREKNLRKIILIAGRPLNLENELSEEVYFDQRGFITGKFNIKAVPAVVWQEGKIFKIQEVALEN